MLVIAENGRKRSESEATITRQGGDDDKEEYKEEKMTRRAKKRIKSDEAEKEIAKPPPILAAAITVEDKNDLTTKEEIAYEEEEEEEEEKEEKDEKTDEEEAEIKKLISPRRRRRRLRHSKVIWLWRERQYWRRLASIYLAVLHHACDDISTHLDSIAAVVDCDPDHSHPHDGYCEEYWTQEVQNTNGCSEVQDSIRARYFAKTIHCSLCLPHIRMPLPISDIIIAFLGLSYSVEADKGSVTVRVREWEWQTVVWTELSIGEQTSWLHWFEDHYYTTRAAATAFPA